MGTGKKTGETGGFCIMKNKREQYIRFVIAYNIVLLIPLLVISISILRLFHRQQIHKARDEMRLTLERQESFFKQQLSAIRTFNMACKYDKKYNERYSDVPKVYLDIQGEFSKQEQNFPFVDAVYLYDKEKKFILTSTGNVTEELFFSSVCRMDRAVFENPEEGMIGACPVLLRADKNAGMAFVSPIKTWGKNGSEMKYLIYPIRSEKLSAQFRQDTAGSFCVIRLGEEVVYVSDGLMEGQDWTKAYRELALGGAYLVQEGELGEGFSSTVFISKKSLYAGTAIYLRGYGMWLLCSLLIGLSLALYFSRSRYAAYKKLADHNEELLGERDELLMESCLYELLYKTVQPKDALWNRCLQNNIYLNRKYKFFVALPDNLPENRGFYEWFGQQMNLYSVSNAYRIELLEGILIYLVCSDESASDLKGKMEQLSQKGVQIGIGSLVMGVEGLRRSYEEARKQLDTFYLKGNGYPERELLALQEAAGEDDFAREKLLLSEIGGMVRELDEVAAAGVLWDVARTLRIETNEVLSQVKAQGQSMAAGVEQFLAQIGERMPGETAPAQNPAGYKKRNIVDIVTYVHAHYLEDNFSVKYMAFYFDTSVSNISHFFKKNMGVTISQYVEQIKLEKAKDMLENSDMRVSEIAQALRYANSTVFIEMFKKYEGVTPGGYRDNYWKGK